MLCRKARRVCYFSRLSENADGNRLLLVMKSYGYTRSSRMISADMDMGQYRRSHSGLLRWLCVDLMPLLRSDFPKMPTLQALPIYAPVNLIYAFISVSRPKVSCAI